MRAALPRVFGVLALVLGSFALAPADVARADSPVTHSCFVIGEFAIRTVERDGTVQLVSIHRGGSCPGGVKAPATKPAQGPTTHLCAPLGGGVIRISFRNFVPVSVSIHRQGGCPPS